MRERHLARAAAASRRRPAPRSRSCGAGRGTARWRGQRAVRRAAAGARDPQHLDRLGAAEGRQDRRQAPSRERLAGAGRPDDEQAVAARRGDLQRVPQVRLAAQVGEVRANGPRAVQAELGRRRRRRLAPRSRAAAAARAARAGSPAAAAASAASGPLAAGHGDRRRRRASPQPRPSPASPARAGSIRRGRARRPARRPRARSAGSCPDATRRPAAIARSKLGPALRRSAGARFAVIRCCGKSKPEFTSAARTRSRDSRTAASGRPTREKVCRPRWQTSTSTWTSRTSMPSRLKVRVVASTPATLRAEFSRVVRRLCRSP